MKIQVINKNEYGNTSIMATTEGGFSEAIRLAKKFVSDDNMDNALTLNDKMTDFENYFVEILDDDGKPTETAAYGGMRLGKHLVYLTDGVKIGKVEIDMETTTLPVKFYIGTDNGNHIYAGSPSRKHPGQYDDITSMKDQGLSGKGIYYINII